MDLSNISINTHSSIRIAGEKVLYFDPFEISGEPHDADMVFITHEHYDHFQPESVARVSRENTVIVAPASMEKKLKEEAAGRRCILLKPNAVYEQDGLCIKTVPAYNCLKPFHEKRKEWLGYIVGMGGTEYYVAGDTDVNEDIEKVRCDVALVPVGGKYTMDKKQAAELVLSIKPQAAVPTHYGSIVGTSRDGEDFGKYVADAGKGIQVELKI